MLLHLLASAMPLRGQGAGEEIVGALRSVAESLDQLDSEIAQTRERLAEAIGPEKERLESKLETLDAQKVAKEREFTRIATGMSTRETEDAESGGEFDLAREVNELLMPIVREVKDATRQPRQLEELRHDLSEAEERRGVTDRALKQLESIEVPESEDVLLPLFEEEKNAWEQRKAQAIRDIASVEYELRNREEQQKGVFDTATEGVRKFVRTRGKNLLFTLLTFVGVFALLRYLHGHLHRISPWHRPGRRSFYARLVDVLYYIFSFVGALTAAMLVLYTSGDWVLLGLAIIVLIGIALAAKNGFPRFYHDGRLLLNLGEVREGERVIYRGLPWKVESLTFFSRLVNPTLRGGVLRLPVAALGKLVSRPHEDDEPWFPCEANDWVRLADGTVGQVIVQTPEMVQMTLLGGSCKTYPVADFLATCPENISGRFRLRSRFGIDHGHREIATTEVPRFLERTIRHQIGAMIDEAHLESLAVEFMEAGRSSLDYEVLADFNGAVAEEFEELERLLQKACVDACNAKGWVIPFTQVSLHNASPSEVGA